MESTTPVKHVGILNGGDKGGQKDSGEKRGEGVREKNKKKRRRRRKFVRLH